MFICKMKMEVNSQEVIDVMRLLGMFGLRFEISETYFKPDDADPNRKQSFRQIIIYGTRKKLAEFSKVRNIIINYHLH